MSVEVNGLSKLYGSQRAVDGLSFSIDKGQVVGFLGPNGAGKSTTMKMLTGYISPTEGSARVCGLDVVDKSLEVRKRVGYLPEHNPLYLDMYVREYLLFIAGVFKLGKQAKQRVAQMIELTGLGREQHKKIQQLSKGYRQRVGLAQALLHDPEVLILDEPTSGLDPNQIVDIRELINQIGKEKTVILSSHIMQEVQAMCSRVIIINLGKLVADDATDTLVERFSGQDSFYVQFKNPLELSVLEKVDGVAKAHKDGAGFRVSGAASQQLREEIFHLAVAKDNPILSMETRKESLEKIFQELTAKS